MTHPVLDEFGRRLIEEVRDETISDWAMIAAGRMKGERADRLRTIINSLSAGSNDLGSLVPEVVDSVLHHLLRWTEEEHDFRIVGDVAGQVVDDLVEESDGFAGELHTDQGWIARFSNPDPLPTV